MRKIKTLFLTAVLIAFGTSAFAADATVTFVSGKVEVQRGGKWVALQKGDTVAKTETISTGFQSEAKIKILDSVMYLGPVTRITLEELSSTGQKDNVNVYLKTGTTRSQVRHADNKRINYQVHTAVAVASCRGTDWIMDDSNCVSCLEGTVAVAAYIPPETKITNGEAEGEKEEGEDESEGSEKSDDSETKEETTEADTAETTETTETESADDTRTTPSSDDGVLVQANQTVVVSETSSVSAPVVTVVQTAAAVTTSVSTAGEKESVGGAGGVTGGGSAAVTATTSGSGAAAAPVPAGTGPATTPTTTPETPTTPSTPTTPTTPTTPETPATATVTVTVELPADM